MLHLRTPLRHQQTNTFLMLPWVKEAHHRAKVVSGGWKQLKQFYFFILIIYNNTSYLIVDQYCLSIKTKIFSVFKEKHCLKLLNNLISADFCFYKTFPIYQTIFATSGTTEEYPEIDRYVTLPFSMLSLCYHNCWYHYLYFAEAIKVDKSRS